MSIFKRAVISIPAVILPTIALIGVIGLFFSPRFEWVRFFEVIGSTEWIHVLKLTGVGAVLALLGSWLFAWGLFALIGQSARVFLRGCVTLPGFALALMVLFVLRKLGLSEVYSFRSVVIAWILAGSIYLLSGLQMGTLDLDSRNREAMRVLGASPLRSFLQHEFFGTLHLQRTLLLQQAWFLLTSFSLVLILNGGPPNETLEVTIYTALRSGGIDWSRALAFAVTQSVLLIALKGINLAWGSRARSGIEEWGATGRDSSRNHWGLWMGASVGLLFWFSRGLEVTEFGKPLLNSLGIGFGVVGATILFSASCYFSRLRGLAELGAWMSPVVLALSIWNFVGFQVYPILNVIGVQTLLVTPWFCRGVFPLLDRKRVFEGEAAQVLGANPYRVFVEIEWPRIRRGVIQGLGTVFALSLADVTSVMLFSRGRFDTVSSHTQNLFSRFQLNEAAFGVMMILVFSFLSSLLSEELA